MSAQELKLTSPKGYARYPKVLTPDTKFVELGQYKSDLVLTPEAFAPQKAQLDALYTAYTGKPVPADNGMYGPEVDKDTGDPTGNIILKLRVKNRLRKDGKIWDRRPVQIDRQARNLKRDDYVDVGHGSLIRVGYETYCWSMPTGKKGVGLQPNMIQIIDLKSNTGTPDPEDYGFADEEGTFGADYNESAIADGFANEDDVADDNPDF